MKFEVIRAFGHANPGDMLLSAQWIDDGRCAHGWLRTKRTYREFIIPTRCITTRPELPEDADYHARRLDPETSHREMARQTTLTHRHRLIISILQSRGPHGATSKEMANLSGIPHVSTSTTMSRLLKRKLIGECRGAERDGALVRLALEYVDG